MQSLLVNLNSQQYIMTWYLQTMMLERSIHCHDNGLVCCQLLERNNFFSCFMHVLFVVIFSTLHSIVYLVTVLEYLILLSRICCLCSIDRLYNLKFVHTVVALFIHHLNFYFILPDNYCPVSNNLNHSCQVEIISHLRNEYLRSTHRRISDSLTVDDEYILPSIATSYSEIKTLCHHDQTRFRCQIEKHQLINYH